MAEGWRPIAGRVVKRLLGRHGLSPVVAELLAREAAASGERAGDGRRLALYLKYGQWLVRPAWRRWFLERRPEEAGRGLVPRHVLLRAGGAVGSYPLVLVRGTPPAKVAFFDPAAARKRVVWGDRAAYEGELAGLAHFGRPPLAAPAVLATDAERHAIEQELVGALFEPGGVRTIEAIPLVSRFHAEHSARTVCLGEYVGENRPHAVAARGRLDGGAGAALERVMRKLERTAERAPATPIPMTRAHNDLASANLFRSGGRVYLTDFDQSFEACLWHDLFYVYYNRRAPREAGGLRARLVEDLGALDSMAGIESSGEPDAWLGLRADLFAVDCCRFISERLAAGAGVNGQRFRLAERALASDLRNVLAGAAAERAGVG